MRIKNQKDFWAGLMFIGFGAFFGGFGTRYTIGTAAKMGPGYFPVALSVIMMVLGAIVAGAAMRQRAPEEKVTKFDWYVLGWVLGSVVLFGVLLSPMGLIISLAVLIIASSYASHEFSWKATLINAVVLTIGCWVIFVWGLKLQFQLWPSFLVS